MVPPEGSLLQEALSGFAEAAGTAFVSLTVSGRVVAATESWWRLGMPEAVLVPWLAGSLPPQAARDYPVYLPHGSPTVPHRLLTLTLLPGLELCLLCGPRPPLSQLDPQLLERWWQPLLDPLRACLPLGPRGLPAGFPLHSDILGLLLLHLELKRCLFTVQPSGDKGEEGRAGRGMDLGGLCHPASLPFQSLPLSSVGASSAPSTPWSLPPTSHQSKGHQRRRWRMQPTGPRCHEPATWCQELRSRAQDGGWWPCS